jgi:hypothetical protein
MIHIFNFHVHIYNIRIYVNENEFLYKKTRIVLRCDWKNEKDEFSLNFWLM